MESAPARINFRFSWLLRDSPQVACQSLSSLSLSRIKVKFSLIILRSFKISSSRPHYLIINRRGKKSSFIRGQWNFHLFPHFSEVNHPMSHFFPQHISVFTTCHQHWSRFLCSNSWDITWGQYGYLTTWCTGHYREPLVLWSLNWTVSMPPTLHNWPPDLFTSIPSQVQHSSINPLSGHMFRIKYNRGVAGAPL